MITQPAIIPSTKAKPDMFRTTGKRAKEIDRKAKILTTVAKADDTKKELLRKALNKEGVIPNYADKMKNKNISQTDKDKLLKMRQMLDKEKPIKKDKFVLKVKHEYF